MQPIQIAEARAHFSALIQRVESGEEIVIARHGKPVARLIAEPLTQSSAAEVFADAWSLGGLDMEIPPELPLDDVLVTDNVGEFTRVDGLVVENWLR